MTDFGYLWTWVLIHRARDRQFIVYKENGPLLDTEGLRVRGFGYFTRADRWVRVCPYLGV